MTGFNSKRSAAVDKLQEPEREALKLALEALRMADELCRGHGVDFKEYGLEFDKDIQVKYRKAITAIKEALAQLAQEPVAWMYQCTADNSGPVLLRHRTDWAKSGTELWIETPLYTTPPLPAQPVREPVAYVTGTSFGRFIVEPLNLAMVLPIGMALYSSPQGNT